MDELLHYADQLCDLEPGGSDDELAERLKSMFARRHVEGCDPADFLDDGEPNDMILVEFVREVRLLHVLH